MHLSESPLSSFELWHIDEQYAFRPTEDTARNHARTSARRVYARPEMLLRTLAVLVGCSLFFADNMRSLASERSRLLAGFFWATGMIAIGIALRIMTTYGAVLRNAEANLVPGTVVRSGFGPQHFVTANPWATRCYAYSAVTDIKIIDDIVLMQILGAWTRFPRELMPDRALARIRAGAEIPAP